MTALGYCSAIIFLAVVNVVPVAIRSSTSSILIRSEDDDNCSFKINGGNISRNLVEIPFSEKSPLIPTSLACILILKSRLLVSLTLIFALSRSWKSLLTVIFLRILDKCNALNFLPTVLL